MLSERFAMRVGLSVAGLISALLLVGCGLMPPTSGPVCMDCTPWVMVTRILLPTPVPADTRIYYHEVNYLLGLVSEISILANGSATYYYQNLREDAERQSYAGRLSAEELKRVILAFEEHGFFALAADSDGCVYDRGQPPPPQATHAVARDASQVSISITMNGISKDLQYDAGCFKDKNALERLGAIRDLLEDAVRDLPAATPTPASGTPEAGEPRIRSEDGMVMPSVTAAEFLREMSASLGFAARGDT